ncbi:unnamed protein product [Leptosia nina]|uniref:SAM domain-containing protein n=1 Tax=Leptosia nina TaxID=320188 RepID=A0AAV1JLL9_9NEOP
MASSPFLSIKTHVSELKNADKESISGASESGTSNSMTSAEDLQQLALILGLNSVEDVFQERVRVDRRRLEAMLVDTLDETQTAQAFFHKVMSETNTLINWPARLKIGARSKKDPHVRIAGRIEDVKLAREKIMQVLDTRSNRVTMKIDVSYTDHSHIIGKGGLTIKRVMEETGCHIHFPDSNRTSAVEKSNQVSIAGEMERVERARARVRALTPLIFSFELPIVAPSHPLPEINSPYVMQIQQKYNVQVMIRNRPKLHANLLVVKGVQWEVQATMEATSLLINYMCGQFANQTQVQMSLEISPMHHPVVIGRGADQLKVIMKGTGAQVMFPDAEDPNIPILRKSCVTITGQIQDVYAARQQLVGSLPLVLIFDAADDAPSRFDVENVTELMQKYNVFISVRRRPKQGIVSVVIKGIERCAGDIYEARRELIGHKESSITAEIPESYNIPNVPNAIPNFGVFNPFSPSHSSMGNSPCSPLHQGKGGATYSSAAAYDMATFGSPMYGQHPPTPGGYPAPISPVTLAPPVMGAWMIPSPQASTSQFHFPMPNQAVIYNNQPTWNPMSNNGDMNSMQTMLQQQYNMTGPSTSEGRPHSQQCARAFASNMLFRAKITRAFAPSLYKPRTENAQAQWIILNQLLNNSSAGSSGYQSNFTGSSVSIDTQNISSGGDGSVASPLVSPISRTANSPAPSTDDRSQQELVNLISELKTCDRRAVGCEKKTLETLTKISPISDYRQLQQEASKAMQEHVGNGYRVPNTKWSGHYFSNTSPATINLTDPENTTPEKRWKRPDLSRPNIVENSPSPSKNSAPGTKQCRYQQLYDMLLDIGLGKYLDLFKKHELDLSTFASLNEADLIEIGVSAFGARRKMLLVIAELQKQAGDKAFKGNGNTKDRKVINSPPKYNTAAITQDKW